MNMKKLTAIFLPLVMLFILCACTYESMDTEGGIGYLSGGNGAAAYCFTWDGDGDNTDIVIPDRLGNKRVKALGGYYGRGVPCPFFIDVTERVGQDFIASESVDYEQLEDDIGILYFDFDLYLGKNIGSVYSEPRVTVGTVNGERTAYCPRVYVHCDEENKSFFSEDGRLYYRETGELVDTLIYK